MNEPEIEFEEEDVVAAPEGFAPVSKVTSQLGDCTGTLVVDISNLAYRSAFAYSELKTREGLFSGHIHGSVNLLLATLKNHIPAGNWCIVFCYDGEKSKDSRRTIMPEYKNNRSADRFNPLPEVKEVLKFIPGIHIESRVREGDDAVAWAVEKFGKAGRHCVVLSGDKDLWTLLRFPWCRVYSPNLKRMVETADIKKNYLVEDPTRITFSKALFGDSSDGIKSVDRLLKKHVEPHLNAMKLNDLESFMELVEAADPKTTSLNTKIKLREAQQQIIKNLAVIKADTTGFDQTTVKKVLSTNENKEAFCKALAVYECKNLINRADEFFGAEFYVEDATDGD